VKTRLMIFVTAAVLFIAGLLMLGCKAPPTDNISDIKDHPTNYQGDVTVQGMVGTSFWIGTLDKGAYELTDKTGTIWVVVSTTPPPKGSEVRIKGSVESIASIGARYLGTVIDEKSRQTIKL
jgi:hypothetical protein